MLGQHYLGKGVAFSPPVAFGRKHSYGTKRLPWFVNIFRFTRTFSQRFFRHRATTWWNALPSHLFHDLTIFRNALFEHLLDVTLFVLYVCCM